MFHLPRTADGISASAGMGRVRRDLNCVLVTLMMVLEDERRNFGLLHKAFRRAATKMNLPDPRRFFQQLKIHAPFFKNSFEIWRLNFMIHSDPGVAATIGAETLTKRKVNINADTFGGVARIEAVLHMLLPFFLCRNSRIPIRNGWITGISRARNVVFSDKFVHLCDVVF